MARYLSAKEAAAALGVSLPTLYAYVSRGLIRSKAGEGQQRAHLYSAEDVAKLVGRKEQRRNPGKAVEEALHWGEPLMDSALTLIADGRLYYRGRDAVELARRCSFEAVVALLWTGEPSDLLRLFVAGEVPALPGSALPPAERFQALLISAAAEDPAAYDLRPAAVRRSGVRILRLLTASAAACGNAIAEKSSVPEKVPLCRMLAAAWAPAHPEAEGLLTAALILCADHELNASSFTSRCVASTGATPYQSVIGGLAALQGTRHGGHTARVDAFFREAGDAGGARDAVAERLRRGEGLPGFGHVLYPDGDPRARALLEWTAEACPVSPAVKLAEALQSEALSLLGEHPTIDFALVTLARALVLPPGSPLALFALGRTAGWIGHCLEQYETGRVIRPRARYTGPTPVDREG